MLIAILARLQGQRDEGMGVSWCQQAEPHDLKASQLEREPPATMFANRLWGNRRAWACPFFAQGESCHREERVSHAGLTLLDPNLSYAYIRQEKRAQTQTFGSGYFQWGGGLPREWGGGHKVRYVPRSPGKPNFVWDIPGFCVGYPGILAGISRGCPKSLRKKVCVQCSLPNIDEQKEVGSHILSSSSRDSHGQRNNIWKHALTCLERCSFEEWQARIPSNVLIDDS